MLQWYDWVLLSTSVIIIVLCLLQGGKSEGASGAITGGGLNVFVKTKERGAKSPRHTKIRKSAEQRAGKSPDVNFIAAG